MTHLLHSPSIHGVPSVLLKRGVAFKGAQSMFRNFVSGGNRKKWTILWGIKRTRLAVGGTIYPTVCHAGNSSGFGIYYSGNASHLDKISIYNNGPDYRDNRPFKDFTVHDHYCMQWDTAQAAAADRAKLYHNNVLGTFDAVPQNTDSNWNAAGTGHYIGAFNLVAGYFLEGVLDYFIFVDDQIVSPLSIIRYDSATNSYRMKKYNGPVGAGNSCYLAFEDQTSLVTLGYDKWNGNHWTLAGWSSVADAVTLDVDTLGQTASNHANIDALASGAANAVGDAGTKVLSFWGTDISASTVPFPAKTGKWYFEMTAQNCSTYPYLGVVADKPSSYSDANRWASATWGLRPAGAVAGTVNLTGGAKNDTGVPTFTNGTVLRFAVDYDNKKFWVGAANWANGGDPAAGTNPQMTWTESDIALLPMIQGYQGQGVNTSINTGQRAFTYAVPAGFKAMNAYNFPTPAIKKPAAKTALLTWAGDANTSRPISGLPWNPQTTPTFLKIKRRTTAGGHWHVQDTLRGAGKNLYFSINNAEDVSTQYLRSFDAAGFTLGSNLDVNAVGYNYYAEAMVMEPSAGGEMIAVPGGTFSGAAVVAVANHSGGPDGASIPDMILAKSRGVAGSWGVWLKGFANTEYLIVNGNSAKQTAGAAVWGAHTSSQILLNPQFWFGDNQPGLLYLFWNVDGVQDIRLRRGNGSAAPGRRIIVPFEPLSWTCKRVTGGTGVWMHLDRARSPASPVGNYLQFQNTAAEFGNDTSFPHYFLRSGVAVATTDTNWNNSADDYLDWLRAGKHFKYA